MKNCCVRGVEINDSGEELMKVELIRYIVLRSSFLNREDFVKMFRMEKQKCGHINLLAQWDL